MNKEHRAGHVVANSLELGRNIMAAVVCEHVRPPKNTTPEQRDETFAAIVATNISKRAGA